MEGAVGMGAAEFLDVASGTGDDIDLPELIDPDGGVTPAVDSGEDEGRGAEDGLDFGARHADLDIVET